MAIIKNSGGVTDEVALLPQTLNLRVYRGDSLDVQLALKDSRRQAIDLEGFSGIVRIQDSVGATLSVSPEVAINYSEPGRIRLYLADTSSLIVGTYTYDLQLLDPVGTTRTVLAGMITVTREVTQ